MAESGEGGTSLAWRLLATLEGGSLLLATSALLVFTARNRMTRERRPVKTVLISNTNTLLGKEIKKRLESHGCTVTTPSDRRGAVAVAEADKVDALVVVGEDGNPDSLNGMADLVSRDVYDNLKILESLSSSVRRGGYMAWACAGAGAGAGSGAFSSAGEAFDIVLRTSLEQTAKMCECTPVWVGRCSTSMTAERIVSELLHWTNPRNFASFIRNAAQKVSNYIGRWLKIIT